MKDVMLGHRQLTSSMSAHQQEYQFDEVNYRYNILLDIIIFLQTTEAEFKKYLNDSKTSTGVKTHKRSGSLTYNEIYWAEQMTNPLVFIILVYIMYICVCRSHLKKNSH